MTPEQIELLLSLSRRVNSDGDELISETQKKYQAHVQRVMELRAMWREAGERLDREEQRFAHYFPREGLREVGSEQRREIPKITRAQAAAVKAAE